jgi:hypothetical protein
VKWVGYPSLHNTWEPLANLGNAMDVVDRYHAAAGVAAMDRRTYVDVVRRSTGQSLGGSPPRTNGGNHTIPSTVADRRDLQPAARKRRFQDSTHEGVGPGPKWVGPGPKGVGPGPGEFGPTRPRGAGVLAVAADNPL